MFLEVNVTALTANHVSENELKGPRHSHVCNMKPVSLAFHNLATTYSHIFCSAFSFYANVSLVATVVSIFSHPSQEIFS